MVSVPPSEWIGDGVVHSANSTLPSRPLVCFIEDGTLTCGASGKGFAAQRTAGAHPIQVTYSPQGTVIGVLSGDGPERPSASVLPMFSSIGGGYYGQHYVDFIDVGSAEPVRTTIRLPFTTAMGIDSPVWSADGRYLVYTTADGTQTCVIHVTAAEKGPDSRLRGAP